VVQAPAPRGPAPRGDRQQKAPGRAHHARGPQGGPRDEPVRCPKNKGAAPQASPRTRVQGQGAHEAGARHPERLPSRLSVCTGLAHRATSHRRPEGRAKGRVPGWHMALAATRHPLLASTRRGLALRATRHPSNKHGTAPSIVRPERAAADVHPPLAHRSAPPSRARARQHLRTSRAVPRVAPAARARKPNVGWIAGRAGQRVERRLDCWARGAACRRQGSVTTTGERRRMQARREPSSLTVQRRTSA